MTKRLYSIINFLLVLIGLVLIIDLIRDSMRVGDFGGYVNAGNAVMDGQDIYIDYLNTWPPFFSIFSVFLALGAKASIIITRFIWLTGSLVSMYFVLKLSVKIFYNKSISLVPKEHSVMLQDSLIFVPLVIILRYIMDNLANVQINIYILCCVLLCIHFFIQKKYIWIGVLLGLTVSLKVYPIFFLFYFMYKREFKPVLWTLFFVFVFNAISFLVFGFEEATVYYKYWVTEVAPRSYIAHHKNQSVFGALLRIFTSEDPAHNLYTNWFSLDPLFIKKLTYLVVALVAVIPAYLFRKKLSNRTSLHALLEYSVLFTVIPILSPISWKAYFIFLWIPYFLLFALLYRVDTQIGKGTLQWLRGIFILSILLTIASTELIVGNYYSDVLEAYSAITIGTVLLLIIQLFIVYRIKDFDFTSIRFTNKIEDKGET